MKNKKNENKKFSLEKIEVAKLNKFQMRTIAGGLPDLQEAKIAKMIKYFFIPTSNIY